MKKMLGLTFSLLLLALAFLGTKNMQPDITELSVAVSCGDLYGCGTIYGSDSDCLIIVTAAHVLSDHTLDQGKEISVTPKNSDPITANLLNQFDDLDIAFLSIEKKAVAVETGILPSQSPAPASAPVSGDAVYFVDAGVPEIYAGSIASPSIFSEDLGMDVIYCYCAVTPGMSGTGLFDEKGHYLGILLGGSENAEAVCLEASKVRNAYISLW